MICILQLTIAWNLRLAFQIELNRNVDKQKSRVAQEPHVRLFALDTRAPEAENAPRRNTEVRNYTAH